MGSLINVTCSNGDLDESYTVGIGLLGIQLTLCACAACRDLVTVETKFDDTSDMRCPACASAVTVVTADDGQELDAPPCPRCGGGLTINLAGLWD